MELDNNDFARLKLSTKMVKIIQRIQKQCSDDFITEERLEDSEPFNEDYVEIEDYNDTQQQENVYRFISLDKVTPLCKIYNVSAEISIIDS